MKNLQRISYTERKVKNVSSVCYGPDRVYTFSVTAGTGVVASDQEKESLIIFDLPDVGPGVADREVDLHYNETDNCIYLIMFGGDIIKIQPAANGVAQMVDIIGTIDQHIMAAQWSPDNSIIAICTKSTLNLLTQDFETVAEVQITDEDIKLSASQISVGWGRVETQFKGKRSQRDPTLPEAADTGTLAKDDPGTMALSWRGDTNYICLSTISKARRVLRVYSREGILESTSEALDQQLSCLSWKPTGSLIMTAQKLKFNSNRCIFFEKNGLKHGELDLRTSSDVLDLEWNNDSTVLAVLYADFLDLWTVSNYHYSLKQRFLLSGGSAIVWHNDIPLRLAVISGEIIIDIQLAWTYTSHTIEPPFDFGVLCMVDGQTVGITPLQLANVPPPQSFRQIHLSDIAIDVAVSRNTHNVVVLFRNRIEIFAWDLLHRPISGPKIQKDFAFELCPDTVPMQVIINDDAQVFMLWSNSEIHKIDAEQQTSSLVFRGTDIRNIYPNSRGIVFQQSTGKVFLLSHELKCSTFDTSSVYATTCATLEHAIPDRSIVIQLGTDGKLYTAGKPVAPKVTSFLLIADVLAYTTATQLIFVHLDGQTIETRTSESEQYCRTIERGSVLVCACPTAQSIVLQAPRGNLETIFPRLLVLSSVKRLIKAKEWQSAWRLVKIHRIDPNIMYDCDSTLLLQNLSPFISAIGSSLELDIFLTALKSEDVCVTVYREERSPDERPSGTSDTSGSKVNTICDAALEVLKAEYSGTHLTSILTAYLAKLPSDYGAAITLATALEADEKDKAITHICFLADPQLLYNQALGLYDLSMALLFAQKSQKDPREYVPFLQHIQTLDKVRQHFILDDHLGKAPKALESLLKIENAWEEVTSYVARHEIWQHCLKCLRYDEARYLKVLALYADYLSRAQDHANAGYAYESVQNHALAAVEFERAALWREALYNTKLAGLPTEEVCTRLRNRLIEESNYSDAAEITRMYLDDARSAIGLMCKAYDFNGAILLASTRMTVDELVKPGLRDAFAETSELFSEMQEQLKKQVPRLREVREKLGENPEEYLNDQFEDETPDNVSLAGTQTSTNASIFTRYTGNTAITTQSKKSGKARRRQERQRAKGKKGTIWEEEYLVNSIRRLIVRLDASKSETSRLIVALVRCDMRSSASELQQGLIRLITSARACLDEVFTAAVTLPAELQRIAVGKPELGTFEPFKLCSTT